MQVVLKASCDTYNLKDKGKILSLIQWEEWFIAVLYLMQYIQNPLRTQI